MAFCRLHDEYWAVTPDSLGLDTLPNTATSKYGLVVYKFNILLSLIVEWTSILRGHLKRGIQAKFMLWLNEISLFCDAY